jgi:molybdopterin converting factor small subunit/predicted ester cyclase
MTRGQGHVEVDIAGGTLRDALAALFVVYPGIQDRILTERCELRQHVNVFVGEREARTMAGLATPLPDGVEISIIPAISGGSDAPEAGVTRTFDHHATSTVPPVLLAYIEGLETHDAPKIAATVADDLCFITPGAILDKQVFLSFLQALYAAFPDWSYDHDEPELRGDEIAVKWRQSGTHSGTLALPGFPALAPTGKKVKIPEQFFFYRVSADRIIEIRPEPIAGGAPQGILQQIGAEWPAS